MTVEVHERNYPTYRLEVAAVVFVQKIWRYYLYGEKIRHLLITQFEACVHIKVSEFHTIKGH